MSLYENTDPWRKFKADHGKPHRDNWWWRAATLIVFASLGAVLAAVIGALMNPTLPGEGLWDNVIRDPWANVLLRMSVGAAAGIVVGAAYVVWCWREMNAMPPRRHYSFRDRD